MKENKLAGKKYFPQNPGKTEWDEENSQLIVKSGQNMSQSLCLTRLVLGPVYIVGKEKIVS